LRVDWIGNIEDDIDSDLELEENYDKYGPDVLRPVKGKEYLR